MAFEQEERCINTYLSHTCHFSTSSYILLIPANVKILGKQAILSVTVSLSYEGKQAILSVTVSLFYDLFLRICDNS
jgi:hypothetical protein